MDKRHGLRRCVTDVYGEAIFKAPRLKLHVVIWTFDVSRSYPSPSPNRCSVTASVLQMLDIVTRVARQLCVPTYFHVILTQNRIRLWLGLPSPTNTLPLLCMIYQTNHVTCFNSASILLLMNSFPSINMLSQFLKSPLLSIFYFLFFTFVFHELYKLWLLGNSSTKRPNYSVTPQWASYINYSITFAENGHTFPSPPLI